MSNPTLSLLLNVSFIGVIFLLIGLVFILSLTQEIRPNEKIILGNIELLKSSIEEVCSVGRTSKTVENFTLPQQEFNWVFQASNHINRNIDPNYVLYHESFPIGQGISWETYLNEKLPDKVFFVIMDLENPSFGDINKFKASVNNHISNELVTDESYSIIIPNIELSQDFKISTLEKTSGTTTSSDGKIDSNGNYIFDFFTGSEVENGLSQKYFSCGDNQLCAKTNSGIYKYNLRCDSTLVDNGFNFYLTSPCREAKISITKEKDCSKVCKNWRSYPVYKYDNETEAFSENDIKHFCADEVKKTNIPSETDILSEIPSSCVNVHVEEYEGSCLSEKSKVAEYSKEGIMKIGGRDILYYELTTEKVSGALRETQQKLPGDTWFWPFVNDVRG